MTTWTYRSSPIGLKTPGARGPWSSRANCSASTFVRTSARYLRVEGDRRAVALDGCFDLTDVVADLCIGADRDAGIAIGADLELHDVGRLVGDQGGRTNCSEEFVTIDDGAGRVRRGHHRLVVRELTVDEAAHEIHALEMEEDLVARLGQDDLDGAVIVGEHAHELHQCPGGHDDAGVSNGIEHRDGLHGDAVVVGCGQRQRLALEAAEDAGEDGPGLVGRRREGSLLEGLTEDVLGYAGRGPLAGRLDCRELLGIDALQVRLESARSGDPAFPPLRARGRYGRRPAANSRGRSGVWRGPSLRHPTRSCRAPSR